MTAHDPGKILDDRRRRFADSASNLRCVLPAGSPAARNYPQNTYPFRASSHFLYLIGGELGPRLAGASLSFDPERSWILFAAEPDPDDALWHGPRPSLTELAERLGIRVRPLSELANWLRAGPYALPPGTWNPELTVGQDPTRSEQLAQHLVDLRLVHDLGALAELRQAADATVAAHLAGMAATRVGDREWHVRAAMEGTLMQRGCATAYGSIVTTRGEVLHNHDHHGELRSGDLLLADVGAETPGGWAGDVTRTWPVNGSFSPSQRALYEVVREAQRAAIACVQPGMRFRQVHLAAARALAGGLVELGILRGPAEARVDDGSYALFMPHGVGHLLGLDVHDMEDLGDRAGYPNGRSRDRQFGLSNLRLDRELEAGMVVTIEPGFYQVPALLAGPERVGLSASHVVPEQLARFDDVRGIRIEDDVLVGQAGPEVLTRALPSAPSEIEALVHL